MQPYGLLYTMLWELFAPLWPVLLLYILSWLMVWCWDDCRVAMSHLRKTYKAVAKKEQSELQLQERSSTVTLDEQIVVR